MMMMNWPGLVGSGRRAGPANASEPAPNHNKGDCTVAGVGVNNLMPSIPPSIPESSIATVVDASPFPLDGEETRTPPRYVVAPCWNATARIVESLDHAYCVTKSSEKERRCCCHVNRSSSDRWPDCGLAGSTPKRYAK